MEMEDSTTQLDEQGLDDQPKGNRKKKNRAFEIYISRVLKTVSETHGITANAKQQLNSAICIVAQHLADKIIRLTSVSGKKTLSEKEIANACRLVFEKNWASQVLTFADESAKRFANYTENKHNTRQNKAGIIFSPSIAEKFLRNFGYTKVMVTKMAPVYFASVLESLVRQVLVHAIPFASEDKHIRLTIRDLELSVRTTPALLRVFDQYRINFIGGGVVPQIHESLLVRKPRKKKNKPEISLPEGKKSHRFRPGTVSLREIKKLQKVSDCLFFAKLPFERLVRRLISQYQDGVKISKEVFVISQYYIEQYIVDLLRDANATAVHSGRVKLLPTDIEFITRLRKYPQLDPILYRPAPVMEAETA